MHTDNLETGKLFGLSHGLKVCTSACYLGGFIGDDESKSAWLLNRMLKWENNIRMISKTADKYNHENYAAVIHVIQLEWIFL